VVVIMTIGIMLAIVLHGVSFGWIKARRINCANNMRQIGLALVQYNELHDTLPPGWVCDRTSRPRSEWGWGALILPMMEQQYLYGEMRPGHNSIGDLLGQGSPGRDFCETTISTYTCPSDRSKGAKKAQPHDWGGIGQWSAPPTNYIANVGFFCRTANYENHGVMYGNSSVPIWSIADGASSTFLLGERDRLGGGATWVGVANPQDSGADGFGWVGGVVSMPMNTRTALEGRDQGFASQHPGGSQFAFCDASVHFISETIDSSNGSADPFDSTSNTRLTEEEMAGLGVYQQLGVRDDKRPIVKMP
jgi:prepilin-type processing-associated H-X9-DG protein